MEHSFIFWCLAVLASIFVGMGKGGLPVIAALAVPSMALLISPIAAAALLLPVYIVSDIFALMAYRRDYDKAVLKLAFIGMTAGVVIGTLTAHLIIEWIITLLIGVMGTVYALKMLLEKPQGPRLNTQKLNSLKGYFWTTIAGFTSFIS